jgi:hypothetical protein
MNGPEPDRHAGKVRPQLHLPERPWVATSAGDAAAFDSLDAALTAIAQGIPFLPSPVRQSAEMAVLPR